MAKPTTPIRLLPALAALAAIALAVSGCGAGDADVDRGRTLFIQNCGTCHAMAQAGTTAQIGPDMDDAFAAARASGQTDSTIAGVVAAQIEYPRPGTDNPAVSMPADIVTGKDVDDVAAYVGEYAGVPGVEPPQAPGGPGAQVFANNGCGGCHALAAAGSGGTVGPDLDEVLPGQSAAMVQASILQPNEEITEGFPPNVMPADYERTLTPKEVEDLVQYLLRSTSNGAG